MGAKYTLSHKPFWVRSSHGFLIANYESGEIISVHSDKEPEDYLPNIKKFDIERYKFVHKTDSIPKELDILRIGFWLKDGTYDPPAEGYEPEIDESKLKLTTERPIKSGYCLVKWEESDSPEIIWLHYFPKGALIDDVECWNWGYSPCDDPEPIEADILHPEKIQFALMP
jgi:hypothetical protein